MKIINWKVIICWYTDTGKSYQEELFMTNVNSVISLPSKIGFYGNENLHISSITLIPNYEK